MAIYMATTKIDAEKTAGEISSVLSKAGAFQVLMNYENREVVGVSFAIERAGVPLYFRLPVRWQPVLQVMRKDKHTPNHLCNDEQAKRVSWRIILRWIEAQLALIDAGSVEIAEVFLPYMQTGKGETLYERISESGFKMLPAAS